MSKKILSLVLAIVMLISVFTIASGAALTEGQVGIKLVSDAQVGAPAGTVVTVDFYYILPDSTDYDTYRHANQNIAVAFTDGFQVNSANVGTQNCGKDALTIGSEYTEVFKVDFTVNDLPAQWTNISAKFNENDTAKGWDDAILLAPSYLSGGSYNATTGYPLVKDAPVFSVSFITTRTLTAEDSIGVVEGSYGTLTKINYRDTVNNKAVTYDAESVVWDYATTFAAAAAFKVNHAATQIQWANEDKNAVNLGFKGTFTASDIDIAFNEAGTSTNVTKVGVELEDGTQFDTRFVYTEDNATYYFRAIVTDIPEANYSQNIKLRYFVILDGETIYSDWVEDNAAAHTSRLPA